MRVGILTIAVLGVAPTSGLNLHRGHHAKAAESIDHSVSGRFKSTAEHRRHDARDLRVHGGSSKANRAVQRRSYKSSNANRALQRRSYNFPYKVDLVTEGILAAVLFLGFSIGGEATVNQWFGFPAFENPCPVGVTGFPDCVGSDYGIPWFEPFPNWAIGPDDTRAS